MAHFTRSSGHPAADRRYDYACGAASDGDHATAADLCEQALEIAPQWAPAWFALGEARGALGENEPAETAFRRALECDPEESHGAGLRIARLRGETPARPPDAYVRDLFDQYASRFETHLVRDLAYRAPTILRAAIERACSLAGREMRFGAALDLGCGTGLMAREMADTCERIEGVDIAPAMAARAQASGLYSHVEAGDMEAFVAARTDGSVDLVMAADVFVYCGDLGPIFAQARRVLAAGGLFAFTVQQAQTGDYELGADFRYAHSRACLTRLTQSCGFVPLVCDDVSVRQDRGVAVPGLALVLAAP
jgi:predicted TPR repeat methyltransferase